MYETYLMIILKSQYYPRAQTETSFNIPFSSNFITLLNFPHFGHLNNITFKVHKVRMLISTNTLLNVVMRNHINIFRRISNNLRFSLILAPPVNLITRSTHQSNARARMDRNWNKYIFSTIFYYQNGKNLSTSIYW